MRGLIVKSAPFGPSRKDCYAVVTRNVNPNSPKFGKFERIARFGWTVVCLGKRDAHELVLFVGGSMYPRPDASMSDEQYERWLLAKHFSIQSHEVMGKHEMAWDEFHSGWVPGMDELRSGDASPAISHRVYQRRFDPSAIRLSAI